MGSACCGVAWLRLLLRLSWAQVVCSHCLAALWLLLISVPAIHPTTTPHQKSGMPGGSLCHSTANKLC